jgi:DNA-directed RNA polymerase I subunit RPA1
MDQVLRLLRAKCAYCHHLRMSRRDVNLYLCKLRLIQHGLTGPAEELENISDTTESIGIEDGESNHSVSEDEDTVHRIITRRLEFVRRALKEARKSHWDWGSEKNENVAETRREVIKAFLKAMTAGRHCGNCNGISPGYRKDRFVKIFEKALSPKDRAKMAQGNFRSVNAVKLLHGKARTRDKTNSYDSDEGIADIDLSSNEDDEGEGDSLDVNGDLVMRSTNAATPAKPKVGPLPQRYVSPLEVKALLTLLFEKDQEILSLVYNSRSTPKKMGVVNSDMFFMQTILVPPNKYRPEARTGDREIAEAQQNSLYKLILTASDTIAQIHKEIQRPITDDSMQRRRDYSDLQEAWVRLQDAVNSLLDRDRNPIQGAAGKKNEDGIKQKLEKKEGLFRKNMMGKRVNFAARSVISPDPNIETNEIGVPPVFARKLTYPEPVTSHNFKEMKWAVINGADKWPGAAAIENENGQVINLRTKTPDERQSLANQLLAPSSVGANGARNKKVHRHLTNGDVVLMNRQPTLHKPSIMGHRARVLPGEKTIRMHYANCNTYNADFDGDEMNMHFPQSEIARAEALQIADTDHQYLAATSGKPLRGLIQDHLSVAVWMTNKDTLFDRETYQQLLYNCLRPENGHITGERIETVLPAIIKPRARWTGKQIITTILLNIKPFECTPLYLTSKSQVAGDQWGFGSMEGKVLFHDGEFISGILDKSQLGPSGGGLIHAVHEAYGPAIAGKLLSTIGRLLTKFLHMRAFTCGMDDLRLTPRGEKLRKEKLAEAQRIGLEVATRYVTLEDQRPSSIDSELRNRLRDVIRDDAKLAGLDMMMNTRSNTLSSEVTRACLPSGLVKQFPKNQMQTMTASGAKGSAVNANLISCNLGQQVLEGRRVPIMVSGKSLPCFRPYETNIRAGGYVVNRFLTGIRPQEYYFHAMAGREGLIDTAVKTSRSGYLQRCLIKGMEGLKVEYDTSVRDSDGSMVQFLYGEDGLDVTKQKHLMDFKFLLQNIESEVSQMRIGDGLDRITDFSEKVKKMMKRGIKSAGVNSFDVADPVLAHFQPGRYLYSTSEKFYRELTRYMKDNPDGLIKSKHNPNAPYSRRALEPILNVKYLRSVVEPGEAVGIVAGQSVGEPSTQMTLNTFHLAGHSAKNVTLGIPRLREIIMTASNNISTPSMTLQVNEELTAEAGMRFAKAISKLSLAEVLNEASVTERIGPGAGHAQAKIYDIRLQFFPSEEYKDMYAITIADVLSTLEKKFVPKLQSLTRKALGQKRGERKSKNTTAVPEVGKSVGVVEEAAPRAEAEREGEDDDDADGDGDATSAKQKANRTEAISYAANDEEDDAVQAQMGKEDSPEDEDMEDEGFGESPLEPPSDDENNGEREESRHKSSQAESMFNDREARIMAKNQDVIRFRFDDKYGEWCELALEYDTEAPKMLMLNVLETALHTSLIQQIPGVGTCTYIPDEEIRDPITGKTKKQPVVHSKGVNLKAMQAYGDYINPNKISTNDIAAMLRHYGVEACRSAIVQELFVVFSTHSINVDNRHLNLIADYMTRGGRFIPFNRNGLKSSVSPFLKMSFETTIAFLRDAVMDGDWDDLKSPSSRIVIGRTGNVGTGAFDVMTCGNR